MKIRLGLTGATGGLNSRGVITAEAHDRRPVGAQIGPTEVERKHQEYPSREEGVKTGPGQRLPVARECRRSFAAARGLARSPYAGPRSSHRPTAGDGMARPGAAWPG